MRIKSTGAFSTSSGADTGELLSLLIASLVRILRFGGLSREDILSAFIRAAESTDAPSQIVDSVNLGHIQRDCMEVLCLWRREPEFLDANGLPTALSIADGSPSFRDLCSHVPITSNVSDLLDTLKAFGAIRIIDGHLVVPETPTFLLAAGRSSTPVAFDGVLKQIAGFVRVVEHNGLNADSRGQRRFERACTVVVAEELLPVFERTVASRGQEFIDVLDEWLERHLTAVSPRNRYVEVGVGAYFVDHGIVNK